MDKQDQARPAKPGPDWKLFGWADGKRRFWLHPDHWMSLEELPDGSFREFDPGPVMVKGIPLEKASASKAAP